MLLVFVICGSLLHAAEVLTQQDVIKLLELKIPEQTISESAKILVKLYPGVFSQVLEGTEGMLRLPGG